MKQQIRLIFLISYIFLIGCGFKPISTISNYKITDIQFKGDDKVNFILKNRINQRQNQGNSENNIKLEINSNKNKIVKEKNIQNEITKYTLIISTNINYTIDGQEEVRNLALSKSGDYDVETNYSQTLTNEKNVFKLLINELADEINKNLTLNLSDL